MRQHYGGKEKSPGSRCVVEQRSDFFFFKFALRISDIKNKNTGSGSGGIALNRILGKTEMLQEDKIISRMGNKSLLLDLSDRLSAICKVYHEKNASGSIQL